MSRRLLVALSAAILLATAIAVLASQQSQQSCPAVVSLADCRVTIHSVQFPERIQEGAIDIREPDPTKYHFALVTMRIDKPAGQQLVLPAADVTLHYRRGTGEAFDVAPCEALSAFSVSPDEDRKLDCFAGMGPGWVKSTTGTATTQASHVYVDAVFAKVERDVTDTWICFGQPGSQRYRASGW